MNVVGPLLKNNLRHLCNLWIIFHPPKARCIAPYIPAGAIPADIGSAMPGT